MNLTEVTMSQEAAAKAFREYRGAFMAERNRIDGELMRGYKALADGKTLISLTESIQTGGVDDFGRPHIAIARADERGIEMRRERDGRVRYNPNRDTRITADDRVFRLAAGTLPELTPAQEAHKSGRWNQSAWNQTWVATTPFIPPLYRPPHALVNYHLLWEAEWRLAPGSQLRDPILLRRIGGDLFAVIAAWELTELEKLVLVR